MSQSTTIIQQACAQDAGVDHALLEEIRQFLKKWYFSISHHGYLYVRPASASVNMDDLRVFLRRLEVMCSDPFPRLVVVDILDEHHAALWRSDTDQLLNEFADRHGMNCNSVSRTGCPGRLFALTRRLDRPATPNDQANDGS